MDSTNFTLNFKGTAVVEVYETSVSQEWKIQAIANANGVPASCHLDSYHFAFTVAMGCGAYNVSSLQEQLSYTPS